MKILVKVIIATFTLSLFNYLFVELQPVKAANSYIDPVADGTNGSWTSTAGNFYSTIDEQTRQPSTPNTADRINGASNNAGSINFRMNSISGISTASTVTVWIYHNDGSNGQVQVQLFDDNETTTRSSVANLTQSTSNAWHSVTFSGLSLTQAQLDTLTVRLTATRNGGGSPATIAVYAMYADVTYTEAPAVSISLSTDGTVSLGTLGTNATQDTTASGVNDVEVINVDSGPANLDVRSTSFSDGSNTWSLAGSSGSEQVNWQFSNNGSAWTTFAVENTLYSLASGISTAGTSNLYLRITTPTSTTSSIQHSATVTVVASAP